MKKVEKIKKVKKTNMFLAVLCLFFIITLILLHQIGIRSTLPSQQPEEVSSSIETESKINLPAPPPQPIKEKVLPVEEKPQPKKDLNHLKEKGVKDFIPF